MTATAPPSEDRRMQTRDSGRVEVAVRLCGSLSAAVSVLTASTLLLELHPAVPTVLALTTVVVAAVQVGLTRWVQSGTVPAADVLEARSADGQRVIAGPAADVASPGHVVRLYGDPTPRHALGE